MNRSSRRREYRAARGLLKYDDKSGTYATLAEAVAGKRKAMVDAGTHIDRTNLVYAVSLDLGVVMLADIRRGRGRKPKTFEIRVAAK